MTNLFDVGGLYQSTPTNLKDARTKAFMYAVDIQIQKLLIRSAKANVWCDIESVDEKYLDLLALESRTLFYNSSFDTDKKRVLISNSIYWYMQSGTTKALEEMISIVFPSTIANIEEWFNYGGEPYHFRVNADISVTSVELKEFFSYINEVKNARSIMDSITLHNPVIIFPIKNIFKLMDFFLKYKINNPSDQIKYSFGMSSRFRNYGMQEFSTLSGRKSLDGTWILDGQGIEIFNGFSLEDIMFSGFSFRNNTKVSGNEQYLISATNKFCFKPKLLNIQVKFIQKLSYKVSVLTDGRWSLNGSYNLDGKMTLNQIYQEEVL